MYGPQSSRRGGVDASSNGRLTVYGQASGLVGERWTNPFKTFTIVYGRPACPAKPPQLVETKLGDDLVAAEPSIPPASDVVPRKSAPRRRSTKSMILTRT
jgi:hypothetical protein